MREHSVTETPSFDHLSSWQLRDQLIDLTVQLADALVVDGDADRLRALKDLYEVTASALRHRGGVQ
jgi:hypothetical protein